jgi:hypothetical protein
MATEIRIMMIEDKYKRKVTRTRHTETMHDGSMREEHRSQVIIVKCLLTSLYS